MTTSVTITNNGPSLVVIEHLQLDSINHDVYPHHAHELKPGQSIVEYVHAHQTLRICEHPSL